MDATQTRTISANMTAYSTVVGPSSEARKRSILFFTIFMEVFFDNKWSPITQFVTNYQELHNNRSKEVFLGIISWPFRIAYRKFFGGMRRLRRLLDTNLLL